MGCYRKILLAVITLPWLLGVFITASASAALHVEAPVNREATTKLDPSAKVVVRTIHSQLIGFKWNNKIKSLRVRIQKNNGDWGPWIRILASDHGPDSGRNKRNTAFSVSDPIWVGDATKIMIAGSEPFGQNLRLIEIREPNNHTQEPKHKLAPSKRESMLEPEEVLAGLRLRNEWRAGSPRSAPSYAERVQGVVIHHTATANTYSCSQVPTIIRSIQRYHMYANGWNDIGYNFIVDRCGGIWEGREGGITRAVIGAHAAGFNTETVGISVLGNYSKNRISNRARRSLRRLISWRLNIAGVNPMGYMTLTARSAGKYPVGTKVRVRAVSAHQHLVYTSCPGKRVLPELRSLARSSWRLDGPKLANLTTQSFRLNPQSPLDPSASRVTARVVSSQKNQRVTIEFQQISTEEILAKYTQQAKLVHYAVWRAKPTQEIPVWDIRVRASGEVGSSGRSRAMIQDVQQVPPDPSFFITTPPSHDYYKASAKTLQITLMYTLAQRYRVQLSLYDSQGATKLLTFGEPKYVPVTTTPAEMTASFPATIDEGSYVLEISLPADTALGRSVYRYPVLIS